MNGFSILSLVIFLPLFGAVVTLFLRKDIAIKWWAFVVTVANFFISLPLYLWVRQAERIMGKEPSAAIHPPLYLRARCTWVAVERPASQEGCPTRSPCSNMVPAESR